MVGGWGERGGGGKGGQRQKISVTHGESTHDTTTKTGYFNDFDNEMLGR